jgi:cytochrome P450
MEAMSIPGPRPFPILGASGNLLRFVLDPLGAISRLFEEHGRIAVLVRGRPTRLASTERHVPGTVFFYGPELNHALLTAHEQFHKCALSGPLYPEEPVSARTRPLKRMLTGLFQANGDEHRQQRRMLMPAFHKSRIESYRDDMVAITHSLMDGFRAGEVRDLRLDMTELTLRVATKTLFGGDMGEDGLEVARNLRRWLELFRPSAVLPLDLPGLPYRRWLDVSHEIDRKMVEVIAAKRKSERGADMLSMLLDARDEEGGSMTDDELIGHAGVIFAAGYETSSNALSWTLFLLSQHPRIAAELLEELDSVLDGDAPRVDQLTSLPLLERVIKESMRILPPVPLNHRITAVETELGGYTVPRGAEVLSSIYHTHRMPEIYDDPSRFRPERWEKLDPGPYGYNPFSAGPRMCIGAAFALMEIKIVLAILLQRYRFELVAGTRIDRFFSITMSPAPRLTMRVHRQDRAFEKSARRVRGNVREMVALD